MLLSFNFIQTTKKKKCYVCVTQLEEKRLSQLEDAARNAAFHTMQEQSIAKSKMLDKIKANKLRDDTVSYVFSQM